MKTIKKISKYLVSLYIIGLGIGGLGGQVTAAEEDSSESNQAASSFSYEVKLPENQHSDVGYFDLRMTPGQKQTVAIDLRNGSEKEITVSVALNTAKTNSNGVVEYSPNEIEKDKSMKYEFAEIVTGPESVTIPAKSSQVLSLDIAMPEASFEGVIAGGIQLLQADDEEDKTEQKGMIVNKFAYVIGMVLSESDTAVEPELALNKVYPELSNGRNAIFVNYSNTEAAYMDDMTTEVQIMKADSDEVIYDTKKSDMRMAPNTMIDFPVSLNGEAMVAGDYQAHILVTSKAGGRWEWSQAFTITDEEANKFNDQDVGMIQEREIDWKLIAMIVGAVFALILVIFILVRTINKNKAKAKKRNRKKKSG